MPDNGPVRLASLGYQTDLAVRRAEGSEITDRGDHLVISSPRNPGYWWGNFLLLARPPAGPDEMSRWLERFEAAFPAARHRTFGLDVTANAGAAPPGSPAAAAFLAAGFQAERNVVLTARSAGPARPPGLPAVIRQLAGDDDWRQSSALRRACAEAEADEPGAAPPAEAPAERQEFEDRRLAARRELTERGAGAWFGAFAGGQLAAQLGLVPAGGGLARYQDVETHPGFRRRGLAGALVAGAARTATAEFGAQQLVIVADPAYHAVRLYRSLGFALAQDQVGFLRPP